MEFIEENQINLNTEIKGLENKNYTNLNISPIKKQKEFDNKILVSKNDILINIICENKPQKELLIETENIKNNNKFKNEFLSFDNKINLSILRSIPTENNEEKKDNIIKSDLIDEKNKEKNLKEIFMIDNNNILYIKRLKKRKLDKMTEITEELNKIEPNNHYELIFKGKINLNENLGNMKIENKEDNNKNEDKNENKTTPNEEKENNSEEGKNKKNSNEEKAIDKGNGLEINPLEIKKNK